MYGRLEDLLLSCHGFRFFSDRLIGGREGEGLSTALSLGLRCGGLESKFEREPGPLDRRGTSWSCLCSGYKRGVCLAISFEMVRLGYGLAP